MGVSSTEFNRSKRPCPDCGEFHRLDRHRKKCFMCGKRRCLNHPETVVRDVATPEGATPWAKGRGRLNTKVFCSVQCADAYEVKVALENTEII